MEISCHIISYHIQFQVGSEEVSIWTNVSPRGIGTGSTCCEFASPEALNVSRLRIWRLQPWDRVQGIVSSIHPTVTRSGDMNDVYLKILKSHLATIVKSCYKPSAQLRYLCLGIHSTRPAAIYGHPSIVDPSKRTGFRASEPVFGVKIHSPFGNQTQQVRKSSN